MVNELLVTVQLLIIYGFAYSLQFVIPKSILAVFSVIPRYAQSSKKTEFPDACSLSFGQIRDTIRFCFSSHTINKYALHSLFSATFFIFLCFLLVISPSKLVPNYSTAVQSRVSKYKTAAMWLMEQICVR